MRRFEQSFPGVVRLNRRRPDRDGVWVAYWRDEADQPMQRRFSIAAYGEEMAQALAIRARRGAVKTGTGRAASPMRQD